MTTVRSLPAAFLAPVFPQESAVNPSPPIRSGSGASAGVAGAVDGSSIPKEPLRKRRTSGSLAFLGYFSRGAWMLRRNGLCGGLTRESPSPSLPLDYRVSDSLSGRPSLCSCLTRTCIGEAYV
jgi:hypothetical protein